MKSLRPILWLLVWLPVSCASDSGNGGASSSAATSSATPVHKPLSQRIDQKNGYKQDTKGNWVPVNDQRSSFESKGTSPYFQNQYQKTKDYQTKEVDRKSWWGTKQYERQKYAGNTDGSRFQKDSALSGKDAHEATTTAADIPAAYKTSSYATHDAREAGKHDLAKPSDAATDTRRKVYPAPAIIDWKEQRSLSVDQSKGILGR